MNGEGEGFVFLSHNSLDKSAVERLAHALRDAGTRPWLDKWELVPGRPWQDEIESALQEAAAVIVCIGPHGIGGVQRPEYRAALDSAWRDPNRLVIPVFLPDAGDQAELPVFLQERTWVDLREDFESGVRGIGNALKGLAPGPPRRLDGACPYPGLSFFDEKDAGRFFGRDDEIEDLLERLRATPQLRMITLVGASGSGKSSLLRAGLVPAVRTGQLDGHYRWSTLIIRPGARPLHELAVSLANLFGAGRRSDLDKLETDLLRDEKTLSYEADLFLNRLEPGSRFLLAVDQFEELFTQAAAAPETAKEIPPFLANLRYAATVADGRVVVLMALRADFLGNLLDQDRDLAAAVKSSEVILLPMKEGELQAAIVRPAIQAGLKLEEGLAETLASEVIHQPGDLPLLQFVLESLWEARDGDRLTWKAYRQLGGFRQAVVRHAESRLDEGEREVLRRYLGQLVQIGEGRLDTLRRARLAALAPEARDLVHKLVDARLMVVRGDADEKTAELAHEALIRSWPRLQEWLKVDREFLSWYRGLSNAVQAWEESGRRRSLLYRGLPLREAWEKWWPSYENRLSSSEREFLTRSRRHAASRMAAAAAVVLIVVGALVAAWIQHERNVKYDLVLRARELAQLARESSKQRFVQRAALLAAQALRFSEDARPFREPEAEAALRQALTLLGGLPLPLPAEDRVRAAVLLADGAEVAAETSGGRLRITRWDWPSPAAGEGPMEPASEQTVPILPENPGPTVPPPLRVRLSRDGRWVAQDRGEARRAFKLAATEAGEVFQPVEDLPESVRATLDADGESLGKWRVRVLSDRFELTDGKTLTLRGHDLNLDEGSQGYSFSPDDRWVLTWSLGEVRLWDLAASDPGAGREPRVVAKDEAPEAGFRPAASWTVEAADGERPRIRRAEGEPQRCAGGPVHEGDVNVFVVSPGGEWLFTAGERDSGRLWRIAADGSCTFQSVGVADPTTSAAFGAGGRWLAIGSSGGRVSLSDPTAQELRTSARPLLPSVGESAVEVIVLSDDARWLFAATERGETRLWELEDGRSVYSVAFPGDDSIHGAAFSQDGHLITDHGDGSRRSWTLLRDENDADKLIEIACQAAGRNLTCEEWRDAFGPAAPYRETCPDLDGPAEPCNAGSGAG